MKAKVEVRLMIYVLFLFSVFSSCNDDDAISELALDKEAIEMKVDDSATINIESGNGDYFISFSVNGIVDATLSENRITLSAKKSGETRLWLTDREGKSCYLRIKVSPNVDLTEYKFAWAGDDININAANGWGLTLSSGQASITNREKRRQLFLSWDGDLSSGNKSNAELKVIENANPTQLVELDNLSVSETTVAYIIAFHNQSNTGTLVIPKK